MDPICEQIFECPLQFSRRNNLTAIAYSSQRNGQSEKYDWTIFARLCHYMAECPHFCVGPVQRSYISKHPGQWLDRDDTLYFGTVENLPVPTAFNQPHHCQQTQTAPLPLLFAGWDFSIALARWRKTDKKLTPSTKPNIIMTVGCTECLASDLIRQSPFTAHQYPY